MSPDPIARKRIVPAPATFADASQAGTGAGHSMAALRREDVEVMS